MQTLTIIPFFIYFITAGFVWHIFDVYINDGEDNKANSYCLIIGLFWIIVLPILIGAALGIFFVKILKHK
jgi:hypothetical protein